VVSATAAPSPGELIWVDFAPTSGTKQSGRRPALVISDRSYNEACGRALVMPVTSRVRGWPFAVALPDEAPVQGVVLVDQVRCIDWRARSARPAGPAGASVLEEARAKLAALAGLN
jgi:mRNA interferase MazF